MKLRFLISTIFCGVILTVSAARVSAQYFDISSGGAPTITGALGGSITGSSSVLNNLVVNVNFGEISPANTNALIKVTVPIAIRSGQPYEISVSVTGIASASPQGIQATDVGFGITNMRTMGAQSNICTNSSHIIYSPFSNDPAVTKSIAANGRVTYQSTLGNVLVQDVILSGPRLTRNGNTNRDADDGYIFNAIFAITPQFYAPTGTSSATLTFTISAGPNVPC
jgi:hypothetical protein